MFGEFNCTAEEFEEYNCNVISTMWLKASKEATILGQLGEGLSPLVNLSLKPGHLRKCDIVKSSKNVSKQLLTNIY